MPVSPGKGSRRDVISIKSVQVMRKSSGKEKEQEEVSNEVCADNDR